MAKLQIFIEQTPIYSNSVINVRCGFFDDDYSLNDVTANCEFSIDFGGEYLSQLEPSKFFARQAGDVGLRATYTHSARDVVPQDKVFITTTTFVIINKLQLPTKEDIYNCLKQEEPQNSYTQVASVDSLSYLDNQAVASVLADLYQELQLEVNQMYPELTTNYADWSSMLFKDVYLDPQEGQINKVLQLLRNLQVLTSMNPYDIAWAITSYIYFRTGYKLYVFINEQKFNLERGWILGTNKSILGVNTYLQSNKLISRTLDINVFDDGNNLDDLFKLELERFIDKITRASFSFTVTYDKTLADFNLVYNVGMTYKGDLRIIYSYCLRYDENAFYEVVGLVNPINKVYVQGITVAPNSGTTIKEPTKLTVMAEFVGGVDKDVTLGCQIQKSNENLKVIGDVMVPNKSGACELTITYSNFIKTVNYISEVN